MLFLFLLLISVDGKCDVRGVKGSDCARFEDDVFDCGDGTKIPRSFVNDDYCDCPNGGDEPGTSACNAGRFWCKNRGFEGEYIFSSVVNDGVCDCCDGSDEWLGFVDCPNTCESLAEEALAELRKKEKVFAAGVRARDALLREGTRKAEEKRDRKEGLDAVIGGLQQRVDELADRKQQLSDEERVWREDQRTKERANLKKEKAAENAEKEKEKAESESSEIVSESESDSSKSNVETEGETESEVSEQESADSDSVETTEDPDANREMDGMSKREIGAELRRRRRRDRKRKREQRADEARMKREGKKDAKGEADVEPERDADFPYPDEYRPPADLEEKKREHAKHKESLKRLKEEKAKEDFPYPEEYRYKEEDSEGFEREEVEEHYDDVYDSDDDFDDEFAHRQDDDDEDDEDDEHLLDDRVDAVLEMDDCYQSAKKELESVRSEHRSAKDELRETKEELEELTEFDELQLSGDNKAWAALYGECFELDVNKYTYEVCPFKEAKQKEGRSKVKLGKFESLDLESEVPSMRFANGQSCWKGPMRSLTARFQCAAENKVLKVWEPSTCTYEMDFATPLACSQSALDDMRKSIDERFKTEL